MFTDAQTGRLVPGVGAHRLTRLAVLHRLGAVSAVFFGQKRTGDASCGLARGDAQRPVFALRLTVSYVPRTALGLARLAIFERVWARPRATVQGRRDRRTALRGAA